MTWPLSCLISQPLFPLWIALIAFLSMMKLCPCFAKCFAILHWDVLDAWYLQKLLLLSKTCPFASNRFQSWPLFTSSRNVLIQMHAWLRPYFHSDFFFFPYQVQLLFWTVLLLNLLGFLFCSALVYYQWLQGVLDEIKHFSLPFACYCTSAYSQEKLGKYLCKDVPVHSNSIQLEGSPQAEAFSVTSKKLILVHVNWGIVSELFEGHPFYDLCCLTLQPLSLGRLPCASGLRCGPRRASVSVNKYTDRLLLEIHYEDMKT